MINPNQVIAPKRFWTLITVLEDNGPGSHSIAIGRWKNEVCLVMRWNGDDENALGNPQSRGLPTWFKVPDKYKDLIISTMSDENKMLVKHIK